METSNKLHAVVVPGPGLGHVNGCLRLGKALVAAGFCVTMVCFERVYTANKGRMNVPQVASFHLEVVEDGLPPLTSPSYLDLFHVTPSMHHNLLRLLHSLSSQQHPATCLISHSFMAWTQQAADLVGIPRVEYWTSNATSYLKNYKRYKNGLAAFSNQKVQNTIFEDVGNFKTNAVSKALLEKDPVVQRLLDISHLAKHAHCVLLQSAYELEREAFDTLRSLFHINALPIGPLFHHYDNATSISSTDSMTLKWLDAQAALSVIFVSFGSNFVHTHDEVFELAHGLEASGKSFLWAIRLDPLGGRCTDFNGVFPHGFRERTSKRGLIMPWVPQLSVLGHPAVGGFLSHCGWNSTIESMWMGVPMLTCPRGAEQPVNNWLISKQWGAGIELIASSLNTFSRHDVKAGVCALLDEPIGIQARAKAKELSYVLRKGPFEGGDSHSNLLNFVSEMKKHNLKPTLRGCRY